MFVLDDPKAGKPTPVMLLYACADGRLKMSVKEKCLPDYWQAETERGKGKYAFINQTLEKISRHIAQLEERRRVTGDSISKEKLKADVVQLLGRKVASVAKANHDFFDYLERFIAERESGVKLTKGNKRFAYETLKHYRSSREALKRYQEDEGKKLTFQNITLATRSDIIRYFQKPENDLATNSIGVIIKHLKVFMKEAAKEGLHHNRVFEQEGFTVPAENTYDVYLTEAELQKLAEQQAEAGHAVARDWFLIECFTGLRISDTKRLQASNLAGGKISISNEKTDETVVIPVHPMVATILARWGGFPPAISEQKINKYIKDVAKAAGLADPVLYTVTKGGVRRDFYLQKWEMISNHTGRRSFITNLIRRGVPDSIIMQLAGIKKATTLQKYNKLSKHEIADVAAELPFFKGL